MIKVLILCIAILISVVTMAQTDSVYCDHPNPYKFKPIQLIAPCTLIGVGVIGLGSDWLEYQNKEIRDELQENIDHKFTVDDFTQYTPLADRRPYRCRNRHT